MALKDGRDCKVKFLIKVVASVLAAVAVAVKSISWHLMQEQQFFLSGKFCGISPRQLFLETEP